MFVLTELFLSRQTNVFCCACSTRRRRPQWRKLFSLHLPAPPRLPVESLFRGTRFSSNRPLLGPYLLQHSSPFGVAMRHFWAAYLFYILDRTYFLWYYLYLKARIPGSMTSLPGVVSRMRMCNPVHETGLHIPPSRSCASPWRGGVTVNDACLLLRGAVVREIFHILFERPASLKLIF